MTFHGAAARHSPVDVFAALPRLLEGVERRGVLHVGANRGQEVPAYRAAGFPLIRLIEPIAELANMLRALDGVEVVQAAVRSEPGVARLHITSWDQASSLHQPRKRRVVDAVDVLTVRLDEVQGGCNVLVIDVQGAELDVLRSGDLTGFDRVIVETCASRRYLGGAVRREVEEHMRDWRLIGEFPHKSPRIVDLAYAPKG